MRLVKQAYSWPAKCVLKILAPSNVWWAHVLLVLTVPTIHVRLLLRAFRTCVCLSATFGVLILVAYEMN